MRKLILTVIVVLALAKIFGDGDDPAEGPPKREIARIHLSFQTGDNSREYGPDVGQWYRGSLSWMEQSPWDSTVYTVPFLVRAAKFEIKRLPKKKDYSGQAGSDLYPVVVTRVIEREYNPGKIPLERIEARLPRHEESVLHLLYYKDRATKYWTYREQ